MRDSRPHAIESLFDQAAKPGHASLQLIQQRALALLKLNNALAGLLPAPMKPWCRVANFRQGVLVIDTANASWMMRLRYEQSGLLSALRAEILPSLSSIDIRINPALATKSHSSGQNSGGSHPTVKVEKIEGRKLGVQSAVAIRQLAARSPEKLRKILERLAEQAGESADPTRR